jgi:putative addiction module killer protein
MASSKWELLRYVEGNGKEPFSEWLDALDNATQRRVRVSLARLEVGNDSAVKWIAMNLAELRVDFGPGYRIYFSRYGRNQLVLLRGGDKSSQTRDISQAKEMVQLLKKIKKKMSQDEN